jgi:hypothetical protein
MSSTVGRRPRAEMPNAEALAVVVSGSFHRHMEKITAAVYEFAALSVRVLSPADPRVVAHQEEFLFVASDPVRSVRLVQDRHLDCIRAASFLWLVCPDGYVGLSAAMEIGAARDAGVPIFATRAPSDLTMREYVRVVPTLVEAVRIAGAIARPRCPEGILINPHASVQEAHAILEQVEAALARKDRADDPAGRVYRDLADLRSMLGPTAYAN